ncbi:MAG TPA: NADH-quinone oxidoreductase subunit NuoF [Anaerolineae bacterium]|nr:NADH-quinone oxidoreductase subunit NuoF [Anaerolineae bacterium]HIQ05284.1 NADH oxidoreductase (quinone) subunit F [Anaerolineae bacterium]
MTTDLSNNGGTSWQPILLRNVPLPNSAQIQTYLDGGGYQAAKLAFKELTPGQLIDMVKQSKLRGRGGAGFPTGVKWGFMPKDPGITKYVVVNADEGEPGTFKDRPLLEEDPHQVLEGAIIAAYAVGAHQAFIYIRGEFSLAAQRWTEAIAEAHEHGFLGKDILGTGFDLDFTVQRGAGAYICGEETALIESLEGKTGHPRFKPPYPAQVGVGGQPTLVQNVETLANVPHIILNGPEWFASIGTAESTGPKIFSVSGHVNQPGNYELPLGTTLREIIYEHAGGVRNGRAIKAVLPGGTSTRMLPGDRIDVPMAFETLVEAGSALGTGGIIVMDETTDIVEVTRRITSFYVHESCGSCAPCRVGGVQMLEVLTRFARREATVEDMDRLHRLVQGIYSATLCPLGTGMCEPVASAIEHFPAEFEARVRKHA